MGGVTSELMVADSTSLVCQNIRYVIASFKPRAIANDKHSARAVGIIAAGQTALQAEQRLSALDSDKNSIATMAGPGIVLLHVSILGLALR